MQVKIVDKPTVPRITVEQLLKERYIGCVDRVGQGMYVRLHLVHINNIDRDTVQWQWVDCIETWCSMVWTKEQAIRHEYQRSAEFHIFKTKDELLKWKVRIDA